MAHTDPRIHFFNHRTTIEVPRCPNLHGPMTPVPKPANKYVCEVEGCGAEVDSVTYMNQIMSERRRNY